MLQLEQDLWNDAEFDAYYGRMYFAIRARFFDRLVRVASFIGIACFVAGLLGLGVLAFVFVHHFRFELRAKEGLQIAQDFAEIFYEIQNTDPSGQALKPLLARLHNAKSAGLAVEPVARPIVAGLVMNAWLDLTHQQEGRVRISRWESRFANWIGTANPPLSDRRE